VRSITDAYEIKPIHFVFIKATEGATFRDDEFKNNWKNAGKTNIKRGAYHFFRSSKDGQVQAKNYIKTVGDIRYKDFPPVLDIETIHKGCSKELLNQRALQWLKEVEKRYGRKPIVYTYVSFARDYLSDEIKDNYDIWIANYNKPEPSFNDWKLWQFTDKGVVFGVPGYVDMNVISKDDFSE